MGPEIEDGGTIPFGVVGAVGLGYPDDIEYAHSAHRRYPDAAVFAPAVTVTDPVWSFVRSLGEASGSGAHHGTIAFVARGEGETRRVFEVHVTERTPLWPGLPRKALEVVFDMADAALDAFHSTDTTATRTWLQGVRHGAGLGLPKGVSLWRTAAGCCDKNIKRST
jgi:hypothetical protein